MRRPWTERTLRQFRVQVLCVTLLTIGAIVILAPAAYMVSASLQSRVQVISFPPTWIPDPVEWRNYIDGLTVLPFGQFFKNSLFLTVMQTLGTLLSCIPAAYAFAVVHAREKKVLFIILLATMMLPGHVTMVPNYLVFGWLGWLDSFKPLIVPSFFGVPLFIFLLRQFFLTIPYEMYEAARIDGAGPIRTLWYIYLPLSRPAIMTVLLFSVMREWNEFLEPLLYLNSVSNYTVSLGLRLFVGSPEASGQPAWMMAVAVVAMLPGLVLFFFAQKHFISGIVTTGVSGR